MNLQVIDNLKYMSVRYGNKANELYILWDGNDEFIDLGVDFYFYPVWGYA